MLQVKEKAYTTKMLTAGEIITIKNDKDVVWTVLGSCVTVIFHVPQKISLICHAVMPAPARMEHNCFDSCLALCPNNIPQNKDYKYVTCSIENMIQTLVKNNIKLNQVHTTVLGGANSFWDSESPNAVGFQNRIAVKSMLAKYKIKINRELTGGNNGLTLWYYHDHNRLIINKHKEEGKFELGDLMMQSIMV